MSIPKDLDRRVRQRARGLCVSCRLPQVFDPWAFHIDYILAEVMKMAQFQYKILSKLSKTTRMGQSIDWSAAEQSLNELVAAGWEVVSSNASAIGLMVFGCGSMEPVVTFVLRRPIQQ
jgi:hypothetical protein